MIKFFGQLLLKIPFVRMMLILAKKHSFPGFEGIPVFYVIRTFYIGLTENSITDRAAAATFTFFMALFPTLLFICTLIPFVPIEGFQEQLLSLYGSLMPPQVSSLLNDTITHVVLNTNGGLLSISVIFAGYFSTNGMMALIRAMNTSANITETRSKGQLRGISFLMILSIFIMSILCIVIFAISNIIIGELRLENSEKIQFIFIDVLRIVFLFIILYTSMSLIYLVVPVRKYRPRFFSPGALLSTIIAILASWGVSFFFRSFDRYNTIYGAIGTIPILLVFLYVNCISLIVGNELNSGIKWYRMQQKDLEQQ